MHLKSVEIQGFKTFARKTELLFEPGITAIVGPNGSGKSNLVDAIRWVLGERSARELRGSRMEEVIYSGGARRPASSMAEVRLVIDNSDGRLPVPYTEVEVLRRGYRSGESDFWLNGTRCRLRDIEALFASTGLTQQGYAVVAQDDIDFIIQTSAAERRSMIEEAAGVRGLRTKRQEAIAKLKEADLSITRLKDLVHELGPRVEELRQQAEQARRWGELNTQLEALRGSLLRGEWLAARQRTTKSQGRVDTLVAQVDRSRAEAQAHADAYAAQRQLLEAAHDARLAFERRMGELRLTATNARSRHELLLERMQAGTRAIEETEAMAVAAASRLATLEEEAVSARTEADAAAGLEPAPSDEGAIVAHEAAADLAEAAEAHAASARAELQELEGRISLLRTQEESLRGREAALVEAVLEAESAVAEAEAELAQLAGAGGVDIAASERDLEQAATALGRARASHEEALAAELGARRQLEERLESVHRLEERIAALGLLGAGDEPPEAGAVRVAEVVDVPADLGPAVEAALGREVLESWVAPNASLEARLLARIESGDVEAGVILAHGPGRPASASGPSPAGASALREHLAAPGWLEPALDILLADTWLVADLAGARALCLARPTATAVTRRGQAMSGPRVRSHPGARTLDVRQRLRRAEAELAGVRAEATRGEEQCLSARVAVEATAAELESVRGTWESAHSANAALAAQRAAESGHLDLVRVRLERVRVTLANRRDERGAVVVERERVGAELASLMAAAGERSAAVAAAEAAALDARSAADGLRWAAESARAERAALQAQRQGAQARRERAEALLARQREDVQAIAGRLAQARAGMAQAQVELSAAAEAMSSSEAALQEAPAAEDPAGLEALTRRILDMERENLERQVAVAHQEEVLEGARAQLATEVAALEDLTDRMGGTEAIEAADGEIDWERTQRDIGRLERQILQLGLVNPLAVEEYDRDNERLGGVAGQLDDLAAARADLETISGGLSEEIDRRFEAVFGAVAFNFQETFGTLFEGGRATLKLDDPDAAEPGVEILAQPAGKRMRGIKLLSGGERALTALAFILALERVNPSPFYIFDEVDAPLDDANVKRFGAMLQALSDGHQYLLVTHNHITMTSARALYGVTLEDSGVSRVVSVRLSGESVVPAKVSASA